MDLGVCSRYEVAPEACDDGYAAKCEKLACGAEGANEQHRVGTFLSQRVASKERANWKYQLQSGVFRREQGMWLWIDVSSIWKLTREPH